MEGTVCIISSDTKARSIRKAYLFREGIVEEQISGIDLLQFISLAVFYTTIWQRLSLVLLAGLLYRWCRCNAGAQQVSELYFRAQAIGRPAGQQASIVLGDFGARHGVFGCIETF